jgi:hypothetical protein
VTFDVALVSCVKSKRLSASPAGELYTSALFRGMRQYARRHARQWFILSAQHHLLAPEQVVAPYERTLNKMRGQARQEWWEVVRAQLQEWIPKGSRVLILAGFRYREHVVPFLENEWGCAVEVPLAGMPFGRQLAWLKEQNGAGDEEA